jgi:hypothetical protein
LRQEITHLPNTTDLPKISARMLLWAINGGMTTISTNLARHLRIPNHPTTDLQITHQHIYKERFIKAL